MNILTEITKASIKEQWLFFTLYLWITILLMYIIKNLFKKVIKEKDDTIQYLLSQLNNDNKTIKQKINDNHEILQEIKFTNKNKKW